MDRTMITNKLSNKSVEWIWEGKKKGYDKVDSVYEKICDVKQISEMDANPKVFANGVTPVDYEEYVEKESLRYASPVEGTPIYIKKRILGVGRESTYELDDDAATVSMDNFFKNYIQHEVLPAYKPAIDKIIANLFLKGGLLLGDPIYNNSANNIVDPSGNLIYDNKPPFVLDGNGHSIGGTTKHNLLALPFSYDNAQMLDVLFRTTNAVMANGEPFVMNKDLVCMVPTNLGDKARVALNGDKEPTTPNNADNPMKGRYEVIENPYLNSRPTCWIFLKKKMFLRVYVSDKPTIAYEMLKDNRTIQCAVYGKVGYAIMSWQGAAASNLLVE